MADEHANATISNGLSSSSRSQHHARQKRARTQLSCTPCRTGKLKCDRASPCEPCVKRGREAACIYPPPPVKSKPTNVKGRIRQLESLVVDLMNQQQKQTLATPDTAGSPAARSRSITSETIDLAPYTEAASPSDHGSAPRNGSVSCDTGSDSGLEKPFGHMSIKRDEISYTGAGHWQTILSSISDLKNALDDDEGDSHDLATNHGRSKSRSSERPDAGGVATASHGVPELGLLVGSPERMTKADLIKAMPDKRTADRLLSIWFNAPSQFRPVLHAPTYQEEYKQYWINPQRACTSWLGLTFAILSLAESFSLRHLDPRSAECEMILARVERLHSLSASAAVLADFTTPKKYTIECLLFYLSGLRGNDGFMKVWLMVGLIVRLALRMGYHRDPKYYPGLTAFEGEIRRRVWCVISMIDILVSFQLGLPSMVKTIATDIEPPNNLLDRDFGPSTKVLPPSRSMNELTPASYMRTSRNITRIFSQAADLGHSTVPVAHDEVMRLDSELATACANVPSVLKMDDINGIDTDPPEQLMFRINLKLLILKTRLILHRNFMLVPLEQLSEAEQAQGIGNSRKICVDSALEVLKLQHSIHAESQLGGKLYTVQWYMGSISTHDFLLAAMVVCLNLSQQISEDDQLRAIGTALWCPRRQAMADTLEKSYQIWKYGSAASRFGARLGSGHAAFEGTLSSDTDMASKALGVMLDRVRKHFGGRVDGSGVCGALPSPTQTSEPIGSATAPFLGVGPPSTWTNTPDHTSQRDSLLVDSHPGFHRPGMPDTLETNQPFDPEISNVDFSAIGDMIDGPVNWDTWDDHIMQQHVQQAGSWSDGNNLPPGPPKPDIMAQWAGAQYVQPPGTDNDYDMNGTTPATQGAQSNLLFDWQDLEDVDLDIRDYGTGGFWGKSPG
jgi:hypothetical protein